MPGELTYRDYIGDGAHMAAYRAYQQKYAGRIRESDRKLIALIQRHAGDPEGRTLLDMGCSTGNLLLHLKQALPGLVLEGADLVEEIIAENAGKPEHAGISFRVMNMLEMDADLAYDVVVANAALMFFDDVEFERAVLNLARAVKPGGLLAVFDLFHPFEETVTLVETSAAHPNGLKFSLRSHRQVRRAVEAGGLESPSFEAWSMPIDLPRPTDLADLTSYTVKTDGGERLSFRGALYQPWCHMLARRR
jgi:trans-aconitate methyltransferase